MLELVEKIKNKIPDLNIFVQDINYEVKIKNKKDFRKERIIYFSKKNNLVSLIKINALNFLLILPWYNIKKISTL